MNRSRVVVLTGASGGFGAVFTRAFLNAGWRIAALDIKEAGVRELERASGRDRVLGLRCDIADAADCAAAVHAALGHFGQVDALVNNGALGMNSVREDAEQGKLQIEDVSPELWARFMATNVNGPFNMARAVVPLLRQRGWGRIINVTTSYVTMMRAGFSPYGPTKAAVEAWSSMLAKELDGTGITVNIVVPGGPADTPMVSGVPRENLISPEVMAAPAVYLLSEEAGAINGQRFIGIEWQPGSDPDSNPRAPIAWPGLVRQSVRAKAWT
jgi:NAD(P)-dependent dehydrogenase (short-subunit alcohol dehydrogenase family)